MKLVVALDYDGTIAEHGALEPAVRAAILRARGRILDELRRVAGDLRFVDAVVAENGAVLAFPATGSAQVSRDPAAASVSRRACQSQGPGEARASRR